MQGQGELLNISFLSIRVLGFLIPLPTKCYIKGLHKPFELVLFWPLKYLYTLAAKLRLVLPSFSPSWREGGPQLLFVIKLFLLDKIASKIAIAYSSKIAFFPVYIGLVSFLLFLPFFPFYSQDLAYSFFVSY